MSWDSQIKMEKFEVRGGNSLRKEIEERNSLVCFETHKDYSFAGAIHVARV